MSDASKVELNRLWFKAVVEEWDGVNTDDLVASLYRINGEQQKAESFARTPFQKWVSGEGQSAKPRKVYVASSWRNLLQQGVVHALRAAGLDVYDFKNPGPNKSGFGWKTIDPNWMQWTPAQWRDALRTHTARDGFNNDKGGMDAADCCVLVLPCGRSAHLEAGFMAAQGKPVFTVALDKTEPELMSLLLGPPDHICTSMDELFDRLGCEK